MSEEAAMIFAFPDQSPAFTYGFEAGQVWAAIDNEGSLEVDRGWTTGFPVREENIELYRRMAGARHYRIETRQPVDGWVAMRLTYVGKGGKPALSLVDHDHE